MLSQPGHAQKEVQLVIGDSLILGPCSDTNRYHSIDLLVKTRFPNPEQSYNKETGQGFYDWYFNGDIETHRLPCRYTGMKFRIASIHTYDKEGGGVRTVVFGQFTEEHIVLWIEIDDAIRLGEVLLP